ncbi:MAG: hypothetical protein ACT4PJ_12445 [Gemmatimonadaceae bacterium]
MHHTTNRWQPMAAIAAVGLVISGCADSAPVPTDPATAVTDVLTLNEQSGETGDRVIACKLSGPNGTYNFTVSHTGGPGIYPSGQSFSLTVFNQDFSAPSCATVFVPLKDPTNLAATYTVTVTEVDLSPGLQVDSVRIVAVDGSRLGVQPGPSGTITTTFHVGGALKFFNGEIPPPPPPAGEGCTPGFWKNSVGSWPPTGFSPNQNFDVVFGVSAFNPDITLLQALNLGGGGLNALARHAVAALLNSSHPEINYGMSAAGVISSVQAALNGGDIEGTKNTFDTLNNQGCGLSNDDSF